MNDEPYTTPEEDPFNVLPFQQRPRRRRSSMFEKWLEEQQTQPHTLKTPADIHLPLLPPSAPFIRYLDIGSDQNVVSDDASILNSYDLVEDDDIPLNAIHESEIPSTPAVARARPRRTSKILHTPSAFRGFNLSFRSPSPSLSHSSERGPSPSSSRISIFPRTPRHSTGTGSVRSTTQQHNKSPSLSTLNVTGKSPIVRDADGSSRRWRRSVLGHFPGSSTSQTSIVPSDTVYTPSRPSVSSADTYTSGTTIATDPDLPLTPSRGKFMGSIRSRNRTSAKSFGAGSGISSSDFFQVRSVDTDLSSRPIRPLLSSDIASSSTATPEDGVNAGLLPLAPKLKSRLATRNLNHNNSNSNNIRQPIKQPDPTHAHVVYSSGGTLPRVNFASLSSRQKKKRKLIVSGVGPKDFKKFEGVKRWCESFGEVSHIMRMPNGDLHVHFRLSEVADTVCRLRAKVHIAGVGSVQLSWSTGDKR